VKLAQQAHAAGPSGQRTKGQTSGTWDALQTQHPLPHRAAQLWWLHPSTIILSVLIPVYLSIVAYDFKGRVPAVYIPSWDYAFGALLLLATVAGVQCATAQRHTLAAAAPPRISLTTMMLLLVPALLAYAVWFGPLFLRPQLLLEVASGQRAELRDDISTVKGVTTFTQFGLAYAIAFAIKSGAGVDRIRQVERWGLFLVFALALFRAFAWAERLAVIELIVCFVVTRMAYLRLGDGWPLRLARVAPAVAPFALYGIFTASEYFRTWEFYANQYSSVWHLSLDRLVSYYATAVNNGVGVLVETKGWPYYSGAFVFESLWLSPGIGPVIEAAFGNARFVETQWLATYGRPEFNSPTAYFRTVLDLGYFGSVVYYLGLGYIIGRGYLGWQQGRAFGLLMYGVLVLHLVESLRYGYLGETRFVPLALGLTLVAFEIHRQRRRTVVA
jgi:oligosaccharide repeat unit polymerase